MAATSRPVRPARFDQSDNLVALSAKFASLPGVPSIKYNIHRYINYLKKKT